MSKRKSKKSFKSIQSAVERDAIIHSSYLTEAAVRRLIRNFDVVSISKPAINLTRLAIMKNIKHMVQDVLQNAKDADSSMIGRQHCMFAVQNNLQLRKSDWESINEGHVALGPRFPQRLKACFNCKDEDLWQNQYYAIWQRHMDELRKLNSELDSTLFQRDASKRKKRAKKSKKKPPKKSKKKPKSPSVEPEEDKNKDEDEDEDEDEENEEKEEEKAVEEDIDDQLTADGQTIEEFVNEASKDDFDADAQDNADTNIDEQAIVQPDVPENVPEDVPQDVAEQLQELQDEQEIEDELIQDVVSQHSKSVQDQKEEEKQMPVLEEVEQRIPTPEPPAAIAVEQQPALTILPLPSDSPANLLKKYLMQKTDQEKFTIGNLLRSFSNFHTSLSDLSVSQLSQIITDAGLENQYSSGKFYFNNPYATTSEQKFKLQMFFRDLEYHKNDINALVDALKKIEPLFTDESNELVKSKIKTAAKTSSRVYFAEPNWILATKFERNFLTYLEKTYKTRKQVSRRVWQAVPVLIQQMEQYYQNLKFDRNAVEQMLLANPAIMKKFASRRGFRTGDLEIAHIESLDSTIIPRAKLKKS